MINRRFNDLAHWDNVTGDHYQVELEIVSAHLEIAGTKDSFPAIEILKPLSLTPRPSSESMASWVTVFLPMCAIMTLVYGCWRITKTSHRLACPSGLGICMVSCLSMCWTRLPIVSNLTNPRWICLSVSTTKTYTQTANCHPILGTEYVQDAYSLTDEYFSKMGLSVRYFMPPKSVAPFAFYFKGDLLNDYTNLELISTISTMETFQNLSSWDL